VTIELPDEAAKDVEAAIASGDYADAQDVLGEALLIWRHRRQEEIERLRRLWEEGLASGEPRPFTPEVMEEMLAEAKARAAQRSSG